MNWIYSFSSDTDFTLKLIILTTLLAFAVLVPVILVSLDESLDYPFIEIVFLVESMSIAFIFGFVWTYTDPSFHITVSFMTFGYFATAIIILLTFKPSVSMPSVVLYSMSYFITNSVLFCLYANANSAISLSCSLIMTVIGHLEIYFIHRVFNASPQKEGLIWMSFLVKVERLNAIFGVLEETKFLKRKKDYKNRHVPEFS